jgi:hypothetical protein
MPRKHIWIQHTHVSYETCKTCGIVRRRDDRNGPCKGPTRLRKMETIELAEAKAENARLKEALQHCEVEATRLRAAKEDEV